MYVNQILSSLHDYRLLIFDFDGTIVKLNVDWKPYREQMRKEAKEQFGLEFKEGLRLDEMEAQVVSQRGIEALKKLIYIRREAEKSGMNEMKVNSEVEGLIRRITEKKQLLDVAKPRLTVLSNNLNNTVDNSLSKAGLSSYFDYIVGLESAGYHPKPNNAGARMILDRYTVTPEKTLFIGDSDKTDEAVALSLSINYVRATWPHE